MCSCFPIISDIMQRICKSFIVFSVSVFICSYHTDSKLIFFICDKIFIRPPNVGIILLGMLRCYFIRNGFKLGWAWGISGHKKCRTIQPAFYLEGSSLRFPSSRQSALVWPLPLIFAKHFVALFSANEKSTCFLQCEFVYQNKLNKNSSGFSFVNPLKNHSRAGA